MGNTGKKPFQNVDLFIEVPKNIYLSGETIQGNVHFGITADKQPYGTLTLGFCCKETILVKAGGETDARYQTTEKFTYEREMVLANFKQNPFSQGQYTFPFEIKLPLNMPSSFSVPQPPAADNSKTIQIKYMIASELTIEPESKYGSLMKVHSLNILRPFNHAVQPLNSVKKQTSRACFCFGNYITSITIYLNTNFAFSGQKIQINGQVNNTNGNTDLLGLNCQLIQRNIVTNEKQRYYIQRQRGALHIVKNFKARRGDVQNFSISYKIPDSLEHSYAIGNYSALVYVFKFNYQFTDGCKSNKLIQIPLYIQTKTPRLESNIDQIPSSYQWNPSVQELVGFDMQMGYQYNEEYPLGDVRKRLDSHKVDVPSFNYFAQMTAGYPTKHPQPKLSPKSQPQQQIQQRDPQNNPSPQQNQVNPYYDKCSDDGQQTKPPRKRMIFQSKSKAYEA